MTAVSKGGEGYHFVMVSLPPGLGRNCPSTSRSSVPRDAPSFGGMTRCIVIRAAMVPHRCPRGARAAPSPVRSHGIRGIRRIGDVRTLRAVEASHVAGVVELGGVRIESVEQVNRRADPGTAREGLVDQAPVESSDDAFERTVPEAFESGSRRTRL